MREAHEDVKLSPEAGRALRTILERNVGLASRCLAGLPPGDPVAAVCLALSQEESMALPVIFFARERDFGELINALDGPDAWLDLWNPHIYPEDDFVEPPFPEDEEFAEAEGVLVAELEPLVIDPYRWVLLRVARRLNEEPPIPLARDGIIYVLDEQFGDELIDGLRFVAPRDRFERLRARGLIGEPEHA